VSKSRSSQSNPKYILNPTTGQIIAEQKRHTEEDLTAAVARAREVQAGWQARGLGYRSGIIRAVSPIIAERAKQLTDTICTCSGKPRVDALGTELLTAALVCRYYPRLARRTLRPKRIRRSSILFFNKHSRLVREPYGVVGIIGPWNYPLGIPMHELVQALLAGNTVVFKVATQSQPVGDAHRAGAKVWICKGEYPTSERIEDKPPYIHPPVVIENADESMLVHKREIFGPVLAVKKVKNVEEALRWANDSRLGLCASIWTTDRRTARKLSARLQTGVVMINDHLMSHGMPETPWGGYKQSSIGRCHGELGFLEVTQAKVIVDDLLHRSPRNFWWLPYDEHLEEGILGGIDALFARALGRRLRGFLRLMQSYLGSLRRQARD